jgi:hypothetical protein
MICIFILALPSFRCWVCAAFCTFVVHLTLVGFSELYSYPCPGPRPRPSHPMCILYSVSEQWTQQIGKHHEHSFNHFLPIPILCSVNIIIISWNIGHGWWWSIDRRMEPMIAWAIGTHYSIVKKYIVIIVHTMHSKRLLKWTLLLNWVCARFSFFFCKKFFLISKIWKKKINFKKKNSQNVSQKLSKRNLRF